MRTKASRLSVELIPSAGGEHCLAVTYQRAPWALGATGALEVSTDLVNWQPMDDADPIQSIDFVAGTETITAETAAESGGRRYLRLKVELVE